MFLSFFFFFNREYHNRDVSVISPILPSQYSMPLISSLKPTSMADRVAMTVQVLVSTAITSYV